MSRQHRLIVEYDRRSSPPVREILESNYTGMELGIRGCVKPSPVYPGLHSPKERVSKICSAEPSCPQPSKLAQELLLEQAEVK